MTLDLAGERDLAIAEAIMARAAARSGPALDFDVRAGLLTVKLGRKRWEGSPAEWARLLAHSDALRAAVAHVVMEGEMKMKMKGQKWSACEVADIPARIRWDTLPEHQGQIVEVQYGSVGSGAPASRSDRWRRTIDRSIGPECARYERRSCCAAETCWGHDEDVARG